MVEFEKILLDEKPDLVIVPGDVNSTIAASLVSSKLHIPVAHVEAGLRSFDKKMPEEVNRVLTDHISDYLFVTEKSGIANLKKEGVSDAKVYFTGNVMIDSLVNFMPFIDKSMFIEKIGVRKKIFNKEKNILGMMPHPERMIDAYLSGEDGSIFFENLVNNLK